MNGSPSETLCCSTCVYTLRSVSTAALRTLRVLARFLRGALDSAGVSSLPDARITYADDATILLFVGAMQALQSATPSRVLSVLLDTTTSEGEVFKVRTSMHEYIFMGDRFPLHV